MQLREGDWVRTDKGEVGKIIHIDRLTAFIELGQRRRPEDIKAHLLSALTKADPPPGSDTPRKA